MGLNPAIWYRAEAMVIPALGHNNADMLGIGNHIIQVVALKLGGNALLQSQDMGW